MGNKGAGRAEVIISKTFPKMEFDPMHLKQSLQKSHSIVKFMSLDRHFSDKHQLSNSPITSTHQSRGDPTSRLNEGFSMFHVAQALGQSLVPALCPPRQRYAEHMHGAGFSDTGSAAVRIEGRAETDVCGKCGVLIGGGHNTVDLAAQYGFTVQ